uniref:peroxisomal sarcosine oxidase-like n=1 Tax=Ciona intestinalis TaxID=7719 RepID=UPI000EF4CD81|nr:peroxisomal sarcosine oxidase-like [Ciona intestinalis]|eukprot:XP_026694927.1 peroxisomal sarcosine oxidase-like [Ciona intestinalis]
MARDCIHLSNLLSITPMCCSCFLFQLNPLSTQTCKVQVTYWKEKVPNIYSKFPSLIYYKVDSVSMYGLPCEAYPGYFKFCFHYHFVVDPDDEEDLEKHSSREEAKMGMEEITEVVKNQLPYLVPEPKVMEPCMLTVSIVWYIDVIGLVVGAITS